MHQRAIENRNRKEDKSKRGQVMQVNQFIGVCLILIAMMAVAIFMAEVASNLVGWIMSIITIIELLLVTRMDRVKNEMID